MKKIMFFTSLLRNLTFSDTLTLSEGITNFKH